MKDAICILGAPAVGKSTIVAEYRERSIQLGNYVHSLEIGGALRSKCQVCMTSRRDFGKELTLELLRAYPSILENWVLLDGTPRTFEQISAVSSMFNVAGAIEIVVSEDEWLKRIRSASIERTDRNDSDLAGLIERRRSYFEQVVVLREHIAPWYLVDNTGTIDKTREDISKTIEIILSKKGEETYERIHGSSR